ncbi:protein YebE [Salmonella enterica subsp. enterica serovar Choleraesuis]|nr:protein YebE [Salmonella enterica subsp. enterica serovar Choleraesuis]
MSSWLNQLQGLLTKNLPGNAETGGKSGGLSDMLVPGALGGLAGLLVASKSSRKMLAKYGTGALLVGGGAVAGSVLWNKYRNRMPSARQPIPAESAAPAVQPACEPATDPRTERLITALVFAARSDGHIDDREQANIEQQLQHAGLEPQGQALIAKALNQQLDPQRLAASVSGEEEALQLYFVSCAAIDIDHFMERSYLDALGEALGLPLDVRQAIELDLKSQKQTLAE